LEGLLTHLFPYLPPTRYSISACSRDSEELQAAAAGV
jgi:hypothetical protein